MVWVGHVRVGGRCFLPVASVCTGVSRCYRCNYSPRRGEEWDCTVETRLLVSDVRSHEHHPVQQGLQRNKCSMKTAGMVLKLC